MIKRRRPEESDEPSEGEATEPKTEGGDAPESTEHAQPEGADESSAETGNATASSAGADESAATSDDPQSDSPARGRKRGRRRRAKAAPSGDSSTAPDDASKPADAPDSEAGAAAVESQDDSASGPGETEGSADAPTGDGADGDTGEPPPGAPPRRRGGRGLALFALLIALAAAGGTGWLGWRVLQLEDRVAAVPKQREQALAPLASKQALDSLEQRLDRSLGSLEDMQQRLTSLANEQQRLQGEHQAVLDDLRTRLETIETALQNMRERRERDGADWRMAEVRYLVSMAVQRLAISGDVAGAIAALQAADQSLARMGNPRVIELRKQIGKDIQALQAVEPADVQGIAVRIQNLAPRIPHLEPPAPPSPPQTKAEPAPKKTDDQAPKGWWGTIREQVGGLVTVRREAEPDVPSAPAPPPEPAPSGELPAGERLLLVLKDASRAALNHAPQAYKDAIDRALNLLDAEYAESGAMVDRFRQALKELRGRRVTTDLPDLGPTLEQTRRLAARLESGGSSAGAAASQGDN